MVSVARRKCDIFCYLWFILLFKITMLIGNRPMHQMHQVVYVLFVCVLIPFENVSLTWWRHYYRWKGCEFWLMLGTYGIEQWGFLSRPLLLWNEASVYNGHLWWPVTLTPIVERLAVEHAIHVLRHRSVVAGMRWSNFPLAGRTL